MPKSLLNFQLLNFIVRVSTIVSLPKFDVLDLEFFQTMRLSDRGNEVEELLRRKDINIEAELRQILTNHLSKGISFKPQQLHIMRSNLYALGPLDRILSYLALHQQQPVRDFLNVFIVSHDAILQFDDS